MRIRCRQNAPACAKQAIEKLSVCVFVGSRIQQGRAIQAVQDSRIEQTRTFRAAKLTARTTPDAPKSKPRRSKVDPGGYWGTLKCSGSAPGTFGDAPGTL